MMVLYHQKNSCPLNTKRILFIVIVGIYLTIVIGITGLALICTVAVLNVYHAELTHPPPQWLHKIVICGLGVLVGMKQHKVADVPRKMRIASPTAQVTEDPNEVQQVNIEGRDQNMTTGEGSSISSNAHQIDAGWQDAEKEEETRKTWKHAAHILDRFFLIIFLVVIPITGIAMLVIYPAIIN